MAASVDPFYVVKDELSLKLETISGKTDRFLELLESTDTAKSPEFRDARRALGKDLKGAEKQLRDLTFTVDMVQKDRTQFAHIDDYELEQRDSYIKKTKQTLNEMKATFQSEKVKRKMVADERKALDSQQGNLGATTTEQTENTHFIHDQQAQSRMIVKQQDEELEELGYAVDRVNDMAVGINDELKTQNKMLNDLEADIDEAAEKMNFVMGKLAKLLKTKDTCQIWVVIILFLILVLLVFLVIYT